MLMQHSENRFGDQNLYSGSNEKKKEKGFPRPGFTSWRLVIKHLVTRKLTYDTDKLPCIAGIASRYREIGFVTGQYCAGFWAGDANRSEGSCGLLSSSDLLLFWTTTATDTDTNASRRTT